MLTYLFDEFFCNFSVINESKISFAGDLISQAIKYVINRKAVVVKKQVSQ